MRPKPRVMPKAAPKWVALGPPSDSYREQLEEAGEEVLDYSQVDFQLLVRSRRSGRWAQHAQQLRKRAEIASNMGDLTKRNEERGLKPTDEEYELASDADFDFLSETADIDLWLLREDVIDWNFVDEAGKAIPYDPERWVEMDDQLIEASNAALRSRLEPGKAS